ncbi:MAG TPA: response regulator [Candidatus Acidoferrales bacterium]|nr:response regulator [Candidatus Acidoferrales bacterium]
MPDSPLILLVDDEQANLELFSTILTEEGYRVLSAARGDDALHLLETSKPDLIISDIYMPEMGGFEFYEKVQKVQELRSVPFIFLSALSDWQHVREGKELGADDYLTKPVDIDELVTTVKGKLKRAASLRSAMQSEFETLKEQILSTLSHELNTPLTYIIGFSEIIGNSESPIPMDELKEFAGLIRQGGDRLKNFVDDFLEAVQIDSGKTAEYYSRSKKEFNLSESITLLSREYAMVATEKNVQFQSDVPDELRVMGSETLIRDAIGRILSNAVKFTSEGNVKVCARPDGNIVQLEIADTGVGIPEKELPRVCEKFYQVNKDKQQQQGAGLGLYIANNLAKINHCELAISSIEGVGTKVTLDIPAR